MKKLKLVDWFQTVADKKSAIDGASLVSIPALTKGLKVIMGDGAIVPIPCSTVGNQRFPMGPECIEGYLKEFFAEKLGEPMPSGADGRQVQHTTKHFQGAAFTKAEIFEWLWSVAASYLDARLKSLLVRKRTVKEERKAAKTSTGHNNRIVDALEGKGWPRDDMEWSRFASFIGGALTGTVGIATDADSVGILKSCSLDDLVHDVAEACSYALGAPFDEVALAEHVGPLCLQIEPSKFLAKTLLRSSIIDAVLGKSLSLNVRRRHFESDWGQLCVTEDANPLSAVVAELLEARKTLIAAQAAAADGRVDRVREICGEGLLVTSTKRRLANLSAEKAAVAQERLYNQACVILSTNMGFSALVRSMAYITKLAIENTSQSSDSMSAELDKALNNQALRNYMLHMEEATEALDKEWLQQESVVCLCVKHRRACNKPRGPSLVCVK